MLRMFESFSERDVVVGWYSTSPEPHVNNLDIHAVFRKYAHDPLFLTIDVMRTEIPTAAYLAVDEVNEVGSSKKTFFLRGCVTVKVLPPAMTELMSGKSPRELALEYLGHNC
uniref:JAB1/MPN/MOV34 metalloenzyme domain-containing protein n=1 Tax=Brassica oleracea TaxID=3712 RepID=A0A3P6G373_BRAOL|nr:unnamed protein product [Brassica oleracea]